MDALALPVAKETYAVHRLKCPFVMKRESLLELMLDHSKTCDVLILDRRFGKPIVMLFHPELIKNVMIDDHKNYSKSKLLKRFQAVIGQGLLLSEGEKWKRDRQKIQPMFNRQYIEGIYFDSVNNVSEKCKKKWMRLTQDGSAEIEIFKEMYNVTVEVILHAIFGKLVDDETVRLIERMYTQFLDYLRQPRPAFVDRFRKLVRHPGQRRFQAGVNEVCDAIKKLLVESRKEHVTGNQAMIGLLLKAQEEDPVHFNDDELVAQIIAMLFAGFESTASTLQFAFHRLAYEENVLSALRAEISEKAPDAESCTSDSLTYAQVKNLEYLRGVFQEIVRIYPSFWAVTRRPLKDSVIGGVQVAKDTVIVISQYAMSQNPAYWQEPEAFKPERHLDSSKPFHPGVFFPFSQGPRKCIGTAFAEMEVTTTIAKLLACFEIKSLDADNPLDFGVILKLKRPLRMEISRRAA